VVVAAGAAVEAVEASAVAEAATRAVAGRRFRARIQSDSAMSHS
jgi:hypothetical protein